MTTEVPEFRKDGLLTEVPEFRKEYGRDVEGNIAER